MALRELVTDPDSFMERKIAGSGLRWETLLLLIIGGLGALGPIYASQVIMDSLGEGSGAFLEFQFIGFAAEPIFGILIIWFGAAMAMHVISSRIFNGRGPLNRLLKSAAWALIPVGIGNLARSIAIYFAFQDVDLPDTPEGATLGEQFNSLLEGGMNDISISVAAIILIITLLYSGYLLSFAVKHSKNIDHSDAIKTASMPIAVVALYIISGLV